MLLNTRPQKPVVLSANKLVPTVQGTYCWRNIINNECVDKISPPEIIANKKLFRFLFHHKVKLKSILRSHLLME